MIHSLALECFLYGYFGAQVSDMWVLGPSGLGMTC